MEETRIHSQDSRDFEEERQGLVAAGDDAHDTLTEMVVSAASACSKLVTSSNYCGLFTNYCDKQLQYEVFGSESTNSTTTAATTRPRTGS